MISAKRSKSSMDLAIGSSVAEVFSCVDMTLSVETIHNLVHQFFSIRSLTVNEIGDLFE
jgi:hypothetical protein